MSDRLPRSRPHASPRDLGPAGIVRSGGSAAGQASVAFLATLPALLIVVVVMGQVASVGYALWSAGGAARAGARAAHTGADPQAAVRAALPPALRGGARVRGPGDDGRVRVAVDAPQLVDLLPAVTVRGSAALDPEPAP